VSDWWGFFSVIPWKAAYLDPLTRGFAFGIHGVCSGNQESRVRRAAALSDLFVIVRFVFELGLLTNQPPQCQQYFSERNALDKF